MTKFKVIFCAKSKKFIDPKIQKKKRYTKNKIKYRKSRKRTHTRCAWCVGCYVYTTFLFSQV